MKKVLACVIVCFYGIVCFGQTNVLKQLFNSVSEESLKANLYYLAGDKCEGRMVATKGDTMATNFVEQWMKKYHLKKGMTSTYRQKVFFEDNSDNIDQLEIDGRPFPKYDYWIYQPQLYAFRKGVDINNAPLAFINYGIATKKYNDFDNLDVKGKVVLHLTGTTQYLADSLISSEELKGKFKDYESKGAIATIALPMFFDYDAVVPTMKKNAAFKLYSLKGDTTSSLFSKDKNEYPLMYGSPKLFKELLGNQFGIIDSLKNSTTYLKNDPQAFDLNRKISIHIQRNMADNITSDNVIGEIQGTDKAAGYIVFTAHRDHEGRLLDSTWYGADDNASGTVAMMECMKAVSILAKKGIRPKRSILFISTTAEEHGLLGAQYFVNNPTVSAHQIKYAINIDMLGRIDQKHTDDPSKNTNYVYPLYYDTLYNFKPMLDELSGQTKILLDDYYLKNPDEENMISRSDHIVFGEKGIPFIWFFSGIHKDYHQPTDTPDKIDYRLLANRTKLALGILWKLANDN